MKSDILINHSPGLCQIDIEGTIGVPEEWQFEDPDARVTTYQRFRDTLRRIAEIDAEEVVVNIRSTGGDVNDALLIHDALCQLPAHITTRFLSKQLQPDVVAVNLATLPPYGDDMRGWKYETHFAYAGEDGTLTCIFRNAGSKNYGFCALDYQATPGGQWSTMIGSWYPVNGSLERSAAPCYRMRASRRYLDNTPDVTIEFVNQRL